MTDASDHRPLLRARGIGGDVYVYQDRIVLERRGPAHVLFELLGLYEGESTTTVFLSRMSAVKFNRPWFLPSYIKIYYPGGPADGHGYLGDVMLSNAMLGSLFDYRDFLKVVDLIELLIGKGSATAAAPQPRREPEAGRARPARRG